MLTEQFIQDDITWGLYSDDYSRADSCRRRCGMSRYQPPYQITPAILNRVADISELLGRWSATSKDTLSPQLRRDNRIKTIQASLAIENNTLSVEQVTAVLDGKRVLGLPREIQEVRNAFIAYEQLTEWNPHSTNDLLTAHGLLMAGLLDDAGAFRSGGVGIYRGEALLHMAPPASRVPVLIQDLVNWLATSNVHPLIASCIFHYEFEFIHPFADGNGRMGRLWQTLMLSHWNPILAYLPVETVIRSQQQTYYQTLEQSDKAGDSTVFIAFMLEALHTAMTEVVTTDQVIVQVTDQVKRLLMMLDGKDAQKLAELMTSLALQHKRTFRANYLNPALAAELVEMTQPDAPRSPSQKYRLTAKGRDVVFSMNAKTIK